MDKSEKKLIIFMPSMEGGGVEKNIIIISNYLSKHIKKIKLITYDNKFKSKFNKSIKIISPNFKKGKISKYTKYFLCIKLLVSEILKNKNSVVFAFQANIYCIILSKLFDFKVIVRSNSSPSGWSKSILKNLIFKFFFKYANKIIVNSKEFKKELDQKFNLNSKLIYNPLNKIEIINKSKKKINSQYFNSKNNIKILNIGRYTDQKDQITLLKATNEIKKIIDFELILIGYGQNKFYLNNFIKKNQLSKQVKILNYEDNPYCFIKKTDIFILSSIYEGLPNVLLEALTLKKFIISTNCPTGPSEILKNGKYGYLYKPKDYKKLSKLIIKFSKNKNTCKKMALRGYNSLDRFDLKINCKKYLNEIMNLS